jgi:hypothetical protein
MRQQQGQSRPQAIQKRAKAKAKMLNFTMEKSAVTLPMLRFRKLLAQSAQPMRPAAALKMPGGRFALKRCIPMLARRTTSQWAAAAVILAQRPEAVTDLERAAATAEVKAMAAVALMEIQS